MSKDPTKRFEPESKVTQPMLETLLKELREFRAETNARLERIEIRLDRVESIALEARADVRELRSQVREALPSFVK